MSQIPMQFMQNDLGFWTLVLLALTAGLVISYRCSASDIANGPIFNSEKAISFAKTDPQVQDFIMKLKRKGMKPVFTASHDTDKRVWSVIITAVDTKDLGYWISFTSDGLLISRSQNQGG